MVLDYILFNKENKYFGLTGQHCVYIKSIWVNHPVDGDVMRLMLHWNMFVHMSCYCSIWAKVTTYIKLTLKQDLIFSDIGYILLAWKLASEQKGDSLCFIFSSALASWSAEFLWTIYNWITNWYRLVMEHYNEVSLSLTEVLM